MGRPKGEEKVDINTRIHKDVHDLVILDVKNTEGLTKSTLVSCAVNHFMHKLTPEERRKAYEEFTIQRIQYRVFSNMEIYKPAENSIMESIEVEDNIVTLVPGDLIVMKGVKNEEIAFLAQEQGEEAAKKYMEQGTDIRIFCGYAKECVGEIYSVVLNRDTFNQVKSTKIWK